MIKVKFKLKIDKYGWSQGLLSNSPYDTKEISSSLSPYQRVTVDRALFAEGQEFLHIDQVGWVSKEFVSEEDNRIQKVQEILSNNYQNENYFYLC
ncbi:putative beta-lactamase class A (plasmid) [Streptococcus oralis]|nr:putative beta-lactamase class A [Streptococcus oralis]